MPNYNSVAGLPSPYPRNAITDYNPFPEGLNSGAGNITSTGQYYSPAFGNWMPGSYYNQEMQAQARLKAGPGAGAATGNTGFTAQQDPVSGFFINPSTRQPFSGTDASGRTYTNGRVTGEPVPYDPSGRAINPNDPNQRYRAVDIVKSPDIAAGESDLMTSFRNGAQDSMKGFDDWLNTFKTGINTAMSRSNAANDPTATIGDLRGNQARHNAALDQSQQDYRDLNTRTAAQEQAIVGEARGLLPEYDRAAQDAANQSLNRLQANVSRYKAASGTPMSLGAAEQQQLLRGAADILVPMEQAKIGQRYNVLSNYAMPSTLDLANRETTRIGSFDPMVAREEFQSGNITANTIQGLLQQTAQMSRQDAISFMQAMSVPAQIQQQILTGQIQQLGALGQIRGQSRYQGLQDVLGTQITPSQYYPTNMGGYPNMGRYSPVGTYTGNTGPGNAPIDVGPQVPYDPLAGRSNPNAIRPYDPLAGRATLAANYPSIARNGWTYGNANRYNYPGGPPPLSDEQLLAMGGFGNEAALGM